MCECAAYCSASSYVCASLSVSLLKCMLKAQQFTADQSRHDITLSLNQVEEEVKVQLWNISSNWSWHTGPPRPPWADTLRGGGGRTCFVSYLALPLLTWRTTFSCSWCYEAKFQHEETWAVRWSDRLGTPSLAKSIGKRKPEKNDYPNCKHPSQFKGMR